MVIASKLGNRFHMRLHSVLGKIPKQASLACVVSALLCHCVDFAADLAPNAGGGESGASPAAAGGIASVGGAGRGSDPGGTGEVGGSAGEAGGSAGEAGGSAGKAGGSAGASTSVGGALELASIRPERSVIETNPDALAYFNLERVLARATGEVGADVYRAYALSFAQRSEDQANPGPRCDDEQSSSGGLSKMNGFSLPCPAEAANLYWQLPAWKPLAITNRFDLAPAGGENCGEQHLSFFFDTIWSGQPEFPVRAYLGFIAVIANPAPERGLEGCRPLMEFWASLSRSEYDAPDRRARAFELAVLGSSLPASSMPASRELAALPIRGFQPLISPLHFGHAGRLQLLYLGDVGEWHFFEHALVSAKEGWVERLPLKQTLAVAALLNDHPKREQCINELLASIPGLVTQDVNLMRLDIAPGCFAATNSTDDTSLTAGLLSAPSGPDLRKRLDEHLKHNYPDLGLQGEHLAKRADFAGTCVGCHVLGDSPWANPSSFSHVSRDLMQSCASSGPDSTRRCYARSPLLNTIFIPHWTNVLDDFLLHPGAYAPLSRGMQSTTAIDGAPLATHHP